MPQPLFHTLRFRLPARLLVLALASTALLLAPSASASSASGWRLLRTGLENAGSLTATPTSGVGGTTGNTIALTYSATVRIQKASVSIAVPEGWSAPSRTTSAPGYVTSTAGSVSINGRTIVVSGFNFG
ncbi:MAG: hypothetical protein QOG81_228, partial [Gaiellaceae bacterium]|nr:hypothetical protein [Gaiellaceae bacterium]